MKKKRGVTIHLRYEVSRIFINSFRCFKDFAKNLGIIVIEQIVGEQCTRSRHITVPQISIRYLTYLMFLLYIKLASTKLFWKDTDNFTQNLEVSYFRALTLLRYRDFSFMLSIKLMFSIKLMLSMTSRTREPCWGKPLKSNLWSLGSVQGFVRSLWRENLECP